MICTTNNERTKDMNPVKNLKLKTATLIRTVCSINRVDQQKQQIYNAQTEAMTVLETKLRRRYYE